ncbi:MAG TPA: tripartite tricarboxylate transporter substrate binding protein [Burkholderiales bacterium]|nr:tripartite tricarboxylate transporter substrate binding protein [Burkholderiales bacterium]
MSVRNVLLLAAPLLASFTLAAVSPAAWSQPYPSRPITTVVGFAPGGATDTVARIVAEPLGRALGQQVVVENRAGAGGTIAVDHVAKAPPDGYTLVLANVGAMAANPHIMKLPYDPLRDLTPISMATMFANVIIVQPDLPASTLKEFIELARKRPGRLTYGSSGVGGAAHLAGELLEAMAKIYLVHVPYRGGGPALQGFLGGQTDAFIATPITSIKQIAAGKARALATTGPNRAKLMPDVPTVAESGYPRYAAVNWYAYYGPKGMPKDLVERLNRELVNVLKQPETIALLEKQGVEPQSSTPEALARYTEEEFRTWGRVVKEAGIKAQ